MSVEGRVYLDWNASAPLRPEARAAMHDALDVTGNPSSVHAEGRAARGVLERARAQVAAAFGAEPDQVVFTSSATEGAATILAGRDLDAAAIEHDCVAAWTRPVLAADANGRVRVPEPARSALQAANSETGVLQELPTGLALVDAAQAAGKTAFSFAWSGAAAALISGHKIGGPKGVGALLLRADAAAGPLLRGGGQEIGRRAGTENLVGVAGFGAAAEAAARDLASGVWDRVGAIRDILESALEDGEPATTFIGRRSSRLPNTTCIAVPGWKGETQVMQMDLAGFAISSGSACSSGKTRPSRTLAAMGFDSETAGSMIRVSIGPDTTEPAVLAFAAAWLAQRRRVRVRAAQAA